MHFQFAPWITSAPQDVAHVAHCADVMTGYTMAVEFRNRSWFDAKHTASTLAFERERGLVNVIVDEPQGSANSIPSAWEVTNEKLDYNDAEPAELAVPHRKMTWSNSHLW